MNVLIVEDEELARERLSLMIKKYDHQCNIVESIDSISDTVSFLKENKSVDLIFLDIQLSDGSSFEIFKKITIDLPIIFTTAYDQYAIQAFKVNSIDYLLKPVSYDDLEKAIDKYKKLQWNKNLSISNNPELLQSLFSNLEGNQYKKRFIVKYGDHIQFKPVNDISYIFAEGKTVYIVLKENQRKYIIDHTLEELENYLLNPEEFFRINRKYIIKIDAIQEVKSYYNSRLKVILNNPCDQDLIISREKVSEFKEWLNL